MRSNFTFDRSNQQGRRRLFFATLLVLFVVLVDLVSGGSVRAAVRTLAAALSSATQSLRTSITESGYFASHASLAAENAALRDEVAHYQEDAAASALLKDENDQLRSLLHLAQTKSGVTAPIVSSIFSSPYGTFLIGAGADAVRVGDVVATSDGFAVGVVTDVGAHTSTVRELFASGNTVNVVIGKSAAQLEGRGGGNARAHMPRETTIKTGDVAVAPQLGSRPVGVVGKVDASVSAAEATIYVGLPIDLSSLRFVYIIHQS